ncbi:MAG: PaREP1 family protein [Candidatus Aramenus sp.]|nr:PaREP1 family protein [Candidatus Aramenus sp.]
MAEADDLLSKGDVVQALEKYKASEKAIKLLVFELAGRIGKGKTRKFSTLFPTFSRSANAIARQLRNNEVVKYGGEVFNPFPTFSRSANAIARQLGNNEVVKYGGLRGTSTCLAFTK